jgi:hypothetical protein
MTTQFLTYSWPVTGATTSRTVPDRLADEINVKDYGAVGDGVTDDTSAIQAALNVAFGPISNPHGYSWFENKAVFFPAGRYKITTGLEIRHVKGGLIYGSGNGATTLTYSGSVPGGATRTSLFRANGLNSTRIRDIAFVMTGGNALANNTAAFNYDDDHTGVNSSTVTFTNCSFSGATYGLLIGISGFQSDTATLINCKVDDCYYGIYGANQNAICSGMFGGSVTDCHAGIYMPSGKMEMICGVSFSGNTNGDDNSSGDVVSSQEYPVFLLGCYSTSPKFANLATGYNYVGGCRHEAATPGPFLRMTFPGSVVIESCHSANGYLHGHTGGLSAFYLVDFNMDNPDWSHLAGQICEWITAEPLTFADLPTTTAWLREGLVANISDSPSATWGANVTTGGGSNHVSLRRNGSNWTVVGK